MKFEIIIPTYKRVAKLENLLDSIERTAGDRIADIQIFIVFDNEDRASFAAFMEYGKNRTIGVNCRINKERLMVFGIWNQHLKNTFKSDALIALSDDTEFIGKGLKYVMEDFEQHCQDTDWLMALNQTDPRHCASFVVIGRKFAHRFPDRQCYYHGYKVCAGDNELWLYAREVNRAYLNNDEVVIVHKHERDQTDKEGKSLYLQQDKELFKDRRIKRLVWGLQDDNA